MSLEQAEIMNYVAIFLFGHLTAYVVLWAALHWLDKKDRCNNTTRKE